MKKPTLSIIVPIFNEEKILAEFLEQFANFENIEILLVDGKSTDKTQKIAKNFPVKFFVCSQRGRAFQMNFGAKQSNSENLFFIHSDTKITYKHIETVFFYLEKANFVAGAFGIEINSDKKIFKIISKTANIRSKISGIAYGDQGLFLKKQTFNKVGGFPEIQIGEDIKISQKLKKTGKITFVGQTLKTSPRRWENEGIIFVTLRNWFLAVLIILDFNPEKIAKFYKNKR
ncbi:TIGR04283 family arsenosugar biosynthesis glycosyltransferase [bacterium]|nr:TIGR04283 family arsenosugar biosynthesis glycosyltransferase [bacterium]